MVVAANYAIRGLAFFGSGCSIFPLMDAFRTKGFLCKIAHVANVALSAMALYAFGAAISPGMGVVEALHQGAWASLPFFAGGHACNVFARNFASFVKTIFF